MSTSVPDTAAVTGAPPELDFTIAGVAADTSAATPTLVFEVRLSASNDTPIRSVGLNIQLRIAAERRRYDEATRERLGEVFGAPEQWASSLGPLPWAQTGVSVPPFTGATVIEVSVPCTYDFEVVAGKYLAALEDGEVPVEMLFNGTLFFAGAHGGLQVAHISWEADASHRLPVEVWRRAVEASFPDSAWLRLGHETLQRLQAYRSRHGFTTWDDAMHTLLDEEA